MARKERIRRKRRKIIRKKKEEDGEENRETSITKEGRHRLKKEENSFAEESFQDKVRENQKPKIMETEKQKV